MADFMPTPIQPFNFWCQKVLPAIFDDSMSYYETLCKMVTYLNEVITSQNTLGTEVVRFENQMTTSFNNLVDLFNQLKAYVDNYFDNLDVQEEINKKLDDLVADGTLSNLLQPLFNSLQTQLTTLNGRVDTILVSGTPTEGNAELIDIRTEYNGLSAATAGEAVREQTEWFVKSKVIMDETTGEQLSATPTRSPALRSVENPIVIKNDFVKISGSVKVCVKSISTLTISLCDFTSREILFQLGSKEIVDLDVPTLIDISSEVVYLPAGTYGIRITSNTASMYYFSNFANQIRYGNYNGFEYPSIPSFFDTTAVVPMQKNNPSIIIPMKLTISPISNSYTQPVYYNNIAGIQSIYDFNKMLTWSGGTVGTRTNNSFVFGSTSSTANTGCQTTNIYLSDINKELVFSAELTRTVGSVLVFIQYTTATGSNKTVLIGNFTTEIKFSVDFANLAIYEDFSGTAFNIIFASNVVSTFTLSNINIVFSNIANRSIYSPDFDTLIANIDSKIDTIATPTDFKLTSPDGSVFKIKVQNDGTLYTQKQVYKKVAVFGNSLTLGWKNLFGIAANNINNDWYYHLNTALSEKVSGYEAIRNQCYPFEGNYPESDLTAWINTYINTLDVDTDTVIIQAGDNVNTDLAFNRLSTYIPTLLNAINLRLNNPKIIWVAMWYFKQRVYDYLTDQKSVFGFELIPINDLNIAINRAKIGDVVTFPDGTTETITTSGVASHPGNLGMKAISDRILSYIE